MRWPRRHPSCSPSPLAERWPLNHSRRSRLPRSTSRAHFSLGGLNRRDLTDPEPGLLERRVPLTSAPSNGQSSTQDRSRWEEGRTQHQESWPSSRLLCMAISKPLTSLGSHVDMPTLSIVVRGQVHGTRPERGPACKVPEVFQARPGCSRLPGPGLGCGWKWEASPALRRPLWWSLLGPSGGLQGCPLLGWLPHHAG